MFGFTKTCLRFSKFLTVCLLIVLVAVSSGSSIASSQSLGNLDEPTNVWMTYSKADWLASDSVLSAYQANDGFTWIGTNNGLSIRSSSGQWLSLSTADGLAGQIVTDITPDPSGPNRRWVASFGGVAMLDYSGDPLKPSSYSSIVFTKADGLVEQYTSCVAVDLAGRIWIGTDNIDTKGNESGYGISVLDTNQTPYTKTDDVWTTFRAVPNQLSSNIIRDIVIDAQNVVWVATSLGLNAFYSNTWTTYSTSDGLPSNDLTALAVDHDFLWIATKNGIAAFRSNGTPLLKIDDQWATYTSGNSGLVDGRTKALNLDSAGRVWVGTDYLVSGGDTGSGLSVLDAGGTPFNRSDDTWARFTTGDGLASNAVRALVTSDTSAWIGTNAGLSQLTFQASPFNKSSGVWHTFVKLNSLSGYSVYAAAHTGGDTIWLATESGLSLLSYNATPQNKSDDTYLTYTSADGLPADGIRALASDAKGRLWIGTPNGLAIRDTRNTPANKLDDVTIQYNTTTMSGWPSDQINQIVIDDAGRAWISTGSYLAGGVVVLDAGSSLTSYGDDAWTTYTPSNTGLPDAYVRAIAIDGGAAWIATQSGVARLNFNNTPFNQADDVWTIFNTSNSGLANNATRDVKIDTAKTVWFAHPVNGVSAYTANGQWVSFQQVDGLATNSVNSIYIGSDSTVWFGTDGGGVSQLNIKGSPTTKEDDVWVTHAVGNELLSGNVVAFARDKWGQVWIGTFGGGISMQSDVQFRRLYMPLIRK